MFENVDGRTTDGRTDDGVTGILIAHRGAFGSGELITHRYSRPLLISFDIDHFLPRNGKNKKRGKRITLEPRLIKGVYLIKFSNKTLLISP